MSVPSEGAAAGGFSGGRARPAGGFGTGHTLPAAVLWDMDGTLVDTEPYWIAAEQALVAEHGGRWSTEDAHGLVGNDLPTSARVLRERGGVDLTPEEIVDRLLDEVVARTRELMPWRPGARELLGQLHDAGMPTALVTMSYRRLAEPVLDALAPRTFTVSVTGDEVDNGKPHPEPYLAAAAALQVDPAECLAIEDSPTGVASALAAGCMVLGVPHVVALVEGPRLALRPSLSGLGLADLRSLASALAAGGPLR